MAWLHTWTGLVLGWVLYLMFVTGTAGYLDTEIDRWMQPEAPAVVRGVDPVQAAGIARAWLNTQAPAAERWFIALPGDRNTIWLDGYWEGGGGKFGTNELDMMTGQPIVARDTGGGQRLYEMHWRLHYLPRVVTDWFIGGATLLVFVAMVTGIIVHKKIFKDFFTFRPKKGQRSWLDAHNALSVLSLPFQLMITYSGLIFMMFVCMPLVIGAYYGGGDAGRDRFFDDVFFSPAIVESAGVPATMIDLAMPIQAAQARWGEEQIGSIEIDHPHDANVRITIRGLFSAGLLSDAPAMTFDGVSGELLDEHAIGASGVKATRDVFIGLHEGLFAGPLLRALYLLSGLMGTAMIATGLILWTVKRRERLEKHRPASARGVALVERLNVGTIIGLPIGIAAYFWANRLIPVDFAARADWEVHTMFLTWLAMLLHAALRPLGRAWVEQCWVAAAAFTLVPVINALITDRGLLQSLPAGDWVFAGFDLTMLVFGVVAGITAVYLQRRANANAQTHRAANAKPPAYPPGESAAQTRG